jgi:hypothetical protein
MVQHIMQKLLLLHCRGWQLAVCQEGQVMLHVCMWVVAAGCGV